MDEIFLRYRKVWPKVFLFTTQSHRVLSHLIYGPDSSGVVVEEIGVSPQLGTESDKHVTHTLKRTPFLCPLCKVLQKKTIIHTLNTKVDKTMFIFSEG